MGRLKCWALWMAAAVAAPVAGQEADRDAAEGDRPTAMVIYADRDNGFAAAALLMEAGIDATPRAIGAITAEWTTDADLVVALACCPGGWGRDTTWGTLLDRIGEARVVACGDTGASLLETKNLLVGHPNGAHWPNTPVSATFSRAALAAMECRVLEAPHPLGDAGADGVTVDIQTDVVRLGSAVDEVDDVDVDPFDDDPRLEADVEHIGIYDGGTFPEGSYGLGRLGSEDHHWVICQQGNYTLWGADSRLDAMTEEGRKLFANLCWHAASAAPQPLAFPEDVMIDERAEGRLTGGSRAEYHHAIARTGRIHIRLTWEADIEMMLMTHDAFVQRLDGKSPLEIVFPLNEVMLGRDIEIEIGSFVLPEGAEAPYELTVEWEDGAGSE